MKKIMALVLAALMLLGCCSFAAAEELPEGYPEIIEGLDFGGQTVTLTNIKQDNWNYAIDNSLHINYGGALRAAYDSPLGPLSIDLNYNNFTRRPSLYLNIGHVF